MGDKLRFNKRDDGDEYEPTDSEDNYSEEEKELLKEVRNSRKRDVESTKELMAFDENDSGEDDEDEGDDENEGNNDLRESDIEGAEDDDRDLPNTMDWGSKSRNYYNTDFVDQDYSTYNEQEEEMAQQEEEEAKVIQMRLAKQMKESDFLLDEEIIKTVEKVNDSSFAKGSSKIKADFKSLSQSERLRLFQDDSPEFVGLVSDFQNYMNENEELIAPILSYAETKKVPMIPALEFTQTYQNMSLSYCSNISFYLLLKAKRISVRNHPIVKRMLQIKKLLQQLQDKYDNIIRPQLEALLERIHDGDEFEILETKPRTVDKSKKKAKLSILDQFSGTANKSAKLGADDEDNDAASSSDDDEMGEEEQGEEDDADAEGALERRGITYQISKNKGLMPSRKKEQRNPRVKHRSKFRKALIRRKGAVRTVRTETKRYGGEMSGIKATVSKSIKFRS